MGRIIGPDGEPLDLDVLEEEIAGPSLTGIRQVWTESAASGLTPSQLVTLLEAAADGRSHDYLTLADDMEERDQHYYSVLGTRKLAIESLDVTVEAATDDAAEQRHADLVRAVVRDDAFDVMLSEQLDALGKGYAVNEIVWDRSGREWVPERYECRDPRWFTWDRDTRRQIRLLHEDDPTFGVPLKPYKFVVHQPRLRTALPVKSGLARIVAFAWICKAYALKDWLAFAEVFGMPLRLGKYGPNAKREDIAALRRAVANLGTDAAAVMPESMKIEFEQVGNVTGGAELFERLCTYLDKQISKAVLGQTMTTDDGSSMAQAKVHNEVRIDLLTADAKQLSATLTRDLVRPLIDLNFGPQKAYPRIRIQVPEQEDVPKLVDAVTQLVPFGLKVGMSTIRDKIGLPDPDDDEELLTPPAKAPAPEPAPPLSRAR
ncbi:DUF935 domain-containing protein, partial [Algiphilus sp.]|uniref:DUF935 domain-containing protein n=1 Tax=Algiphilus sp. TaxID=1872431 RepID=UPI003C5F0B80